MMQAQICETRIFFKLVSVCIGLFDLLSSSLCIFLNPVKKFNKVINSVSTIC